MPHTNKETQIREIQGIILLKLRELLREGETLWDSHVFCHPYFFGPAHSMLDEEISQIFEEKFVAVIERLSKIKADLLLNVWNVWLINYDIKEGIIGALHRA